MRTKNIVFFSPISSLLKSERQLLTISIVNDDYLINISHNMSDMTTELNHRTVGWLVYRGSDFVSKEHKNRYYLDKGDVIKIGNATLKLKTIQLKDVSNNHHNNSLNNGTKDDVLLLNKINRTKKKFCRICLGNEREEDCKTENNPLIQPCLCSGTMKYIHLKCLRQWLNNRILTKVSENCYATIYSIKEVECELCKAKLPDYVKHQNKMIEIISIPTLPDNYLFFENSLTNNKLKKIIYVVSFDDTNKITFGRGNDCNLIISDITVSRLHGHFIRENNRIYIEDLNSKFASLILIQSPKIHLINGIPLNIQVNRTFFSFSIKCPFNLFSCCNTAEITSNCDYQRQNRSSLDEYCGSVIKIEDENEIEDDEIDEEEAKDSYHTINEKKAKTKLYFKIIETEKGEEEDDNNNSQSKTFFKKKTTIISLEGDQNIQISKMPLQKKETGVV